MFTLSALLSRKVLDQEDGGKPNKIREEAVCNLADIQEGEIKQCDLGDGKVLLTKHKGVISAVSAKCTHYGAPLVTGAYENGRVRCPWHGACFNTCTGDIEDFPGLDSLHKFKVDIRDGMVYVTANEQHLTDFRRIKPMSKHIENNKQVYLLLGGGGSSMVCAETLRQEGFTGRIIMATMEDNLPYDRPKLSKMLNIDPKKICLRSEAFLKENNIEVLFQKKAVGVDTVNKQVKFADDTHLNYSKLYIGTGGLPCPITTPGSQLKNIFYLRTPQDANKIDECIRGKDVVVLGTGFIGMEMAAYFVGKSNSVTIVGSGRTQVPFERTFGENVGLVIKNMFIEKGVQFYLQSPLQEIKGNNGRVSEVLLADNTLIKADVIISGIGVLPSTDFLQDSPISLNPQNHIVVNEFMQSSVENIYAGGDIVAFPYYYNKNQLINLGHWQIASAHGRCAGKNMIEKKTTFKSVPFFWTSMFGKAFRYAGYCSSFDEVRYEGSVKELKFAAYYFKKYKEACLLLDFLKGPSDILSTIRSGYLQAVLSLNMAAKTSEMMFKIEGSC